METDTNHSVPWRFEAEEAFLSLSGMQLRISEGVSWGPILVGIAFYVILGFLDRFIPNPMLPGAFIALAMVVPVVAGALWGVRTGALTGLLGTGLLLAVEFPILGFNPFETCGLLAHPLMGAAAGHIASRSRHQIVPGLAILIGHALNLAMYTALGLIPAGQLLGRQFLMGLLTEAALDLILFSVIMSVVRIFQGPAKQDIGRRRAAWAWTSVILLLLLAAWAHLQGVDSAQPLMVLPVALAAILLGPLAAWMTALVPTSLLAAAVIHRGLEHSQREVVTILALNLVALILGELASNLRQQETMAKRRAAVLSAMSHSAEQLLEHEEWEERLPIVLDRLGQAAGSPTLVLYQLEKRELRPHSQSTLGAAASFPDSIDIEGLDPGFARGSVLAGSPAQSRSLVPPECLLLPVRSSSSLTGALLVTAPRRAFPWTSPVRDALRVAADLLGAALHQRETEAALALSEERYALAARGANDGLWDWDLQTGALYLSDRWYEMLGYSSEKRENRINFWLQLVEPEDRPLFKRRTRDHISGTTEQLEVEYRIKHRDGSLRWMLCRGVAIRNESGEATRMAGSQTDITEGKKTEEQILRDAFFDRLTALPNRALLVDRLRIACRRATRNEVQRIGVMLMDIDRLKLVNDSYGHQAGDELIRQLAARLEKLAGTQRTVARIGSDVLAILLEEDKIISSATRLQEHISENLRQPFDIEGHEIYLTLSVGIASLSPGPKPAEQLLQDADTALAEAKARGRARTVVFEPAMRDSTVRRLSLETELRRAIEEKQLRLFYQPIVRLDDGELSGFEALLRWENPNRGLMGPDEFIPVAEEAGLIVSLGEWALLEACASLNSWRTQFPHRHITASVNLHSHQFRQEDLVELVSGTLKKLEIPSEILRLEVTEQAMMEDQRFAVHLMEELQSLGINLYIDDFGTGYSSLAYLVRLPVSTLKIDQSFIIGMEDAPRKRQMVEVILQLAQTLKLDVVAEGIEEAEHLKFLRERGCQYGQGFFFARPFPLDDATKLIASGWKSPDCRD